MAKVVREDTDNLSAVLTITLTKEDYEPKLTAELNKYRKKAHIKGFRKGKTPMAFIKKMYGKSLMADVINELMQEELTNYIQENNLDILGQPIPTEDQELFDFDINQANDYVFKVELGLAPQFEVTGVGSEDSYARHDVEVPDEMVEKDMTAARKRLGERNSVEDDIEENDMLTLNVEELEGEEIKENGWATTFSILVDQIPSEELKKEFSSKKKGDKIRFDIRDLEKDRDEAYIRKQLLHVDENDEDVEIGNHFEAVIDDVSRVAPAEINEDFLNKYFGEGRVKDEAEARELIRKDIKSYYDRQADSLLFRDFQDRLLEQNALELPETFLKKWLKVANEEATDELIEKEFDAFTRNLRWSLIRSKLVQKFDVQVTENELVEGFKDRVRGYFGGYGDELVILNTANRLMQDRQQVDNMYQELMTDKLFEAIKEASKIEDQKINAEAFDEVIKEAREKVEAAEEQLEHGSEEAAVEESEEEVAEDIEQ